MKALGPSVPPQYNWFERHTSLSYTLLFIGVLIGAGAIYIAIAEIRNEETANVISAALVSGIVFFFLGKESGAKEEQDKERERKLAENTRRSGIHE